MTTMRERAAKFNTNKIKQEDLIVVGGAPDEETSTARIFQTSILNRQDAKRTKNNSTSPSTGKGKTDLGAGK